MHANLIPTERLHVCNVMHFFITHITLHRTVDENEKTKGNGITSVSFISDTHCQIQPANTPDNLWQDSHHTESGAKRNLSQEILFC